MPRTVLALLGHFLQLLALSMRSHKRLAAENLFLRKQ
jgi:putative transposase